MKHSRNRRERRTKALGIGAAIIALTVGHFLVSTATHSQHVVHALFQALYLVPVLAGAIWFGLTGSVVSSLVVAAAYSLHLLHTWPDEPLEYLNQTAMVAIFLVVGPVAGALVALQERARQRGLELERRARRAAISQGVAGLSTALGFRDHYTRQHSERVAQVAVRIGQVRGLEPERIEILRLAALVHDLGKIGVPDDILFKPSELTPEERSVIERHPRVAADILAAIDGTHEIATIVLCHHECPNGAGYPRGLRADQIPVEAAILRVADVFCALTDVRSYKLAMDQDAALAWMTAKMGGELDGASVETLRKTFAHPAQRATQ